MRYKVVYHSADDTLLSCVMGGSLQIEYKKGIWVEAYFSATALGWCPCVFETLEQAVIFAEKRLVHFVEWGTRTPRFEIWSCETRGEMEPMDKVDNWPEGTIMAEKVSLTERVR